MSVKSLKKLLGIANVISGIGVIVLLLNVVGQSSAFPDVYRKIPPGSVSVEKGPVRQQRDTGEYRPCWEKGIPSAAAPAPAVVQSGAPVPAPGHFKFFAAFFDIAADGTRKGFASIAAGNDQRVYAEKEMIEEYMLAQVFPEKVILERNGQLFTLARSESTPLPAASRTTPRGNRRVPASRTGGATPGGSRERTSSRSTRTPGRTEQLRPASSGAGSTSAPAKRLAVSQKDRDYVVNNFEKVLQEVNLQTHLDENDSMTGIKIGDIKRGSIVSRVGHLRKGDIIRKVDGTPITSMPQVLSLYEDLSNRTEGTVSVEIERNGKVFTYNYNLADSQR